MNKKHKLLPVVILLFIILTAGSRLCAGNDSADGTGVSAFQLLRASVERLYGRQVQIEQVRPNNPDYCGEASVLRDGTPVIKVNIDIESKECVIVHELLHLKLRKEGFPRYIVWSPPDFFANPQTIWSVRRIANDVRDVIEHYGFLFPTMEAMGLNPYEIMRTIYRRNLESGLVDSFENPVYQVFNYVKIVLESNDPEIVADLERHYMRNKWTSSLQQARSLVKAVKEARLETPEDYVSLTVHCLNALFRQHMQFEVSKWGKVEHPAYVERVVEVKLCPANES